MKTPEANDEIRHPLSLIFVIFCRPPTDCASLWRTRMSGAVVWARGGAGAVVAQRARAPGQAVSTWAPSGPLIIWHISMTFTPTSGPAAPAADAAVLAAATSVLATTCAGSCRNREPVLVVLPVVARRSNR